MIFVTVGTQLPFDRLIRAVDKWCAQSDLGGESFAQIGRAEAGTYRPEHISWAETIRPAEFQERVQAARVIVSHAGMGSIITAMRFGKPIVIVPRRAALGEHRNDHQLATVKWLGNRPGIYPVLDEAELPAQVQRILESGAAGGAVPAFAEDRLIETLRGFIHEG